MWKEGDGGRGRRRERNTMEWVMDERYMEREVHDFDRLTG